MFGSSVASSSKLALVAATALLVASTATLVSSAPLGANGDPCNAGSECSSGNCQGYSGFCSVAGDSTNLPAIGRTCNVAADCSGKSAFCGDQYYGVPGECYFNGASCTLEGTYTDAACPSYTGCNIVQAGVCAPAFAGPSQNSRKRTRRDQHGSKRRHVDGAVELTKNYKIQRRKQHQRSKALCPSDYFACPIKGTAGFECVNLQEELNACGRCNNDCEKLAKPGQAVACSSGQCIFGPEP